MDRIFQWWLSSPLVLALAVEGAVAAAVVVEVGSMSGITSRSASHFQRLSRQRYTIRSNHHSRDTSMHSFGYGYEACFQTRLDVALECGADASRHGFSGSKNPKP